MLGEKGKELGEGSAAQVDGGGVERVGLAGVKRQVYWKPRTGWSQQELASRG